MDAAVPQRAQLGGIAGEGGMGDNAAPKIKEPPVLYESTQSDVA